MSSFVAIYALKDDTGTIRYIGKANDPHARLASHFRMWPKAATNHSVRQPQEQLTAGVYLKSAIIRPENNTSITSKECLAKLYGKMKSHQKAAQRSNLPQ